MNTKSSLNRLELRVERLHLTIRFTYAFHAREIRFECDTGAGFERLFDQSIDLSNCIDLQPVSHARVPGP